MIRSEGLRYGGERMVLYGRGATIWANRLPEGCSGLHPTDTLSVRTIGTRYCRGDLLLSSNPGSGTQGPGCLLGDFVPYRR